MSLLPCDADGYAIPAADILADWYIEHGDDPNEGDPETDWPAWTDDQVVGIGPAFFREESFDDPDQLPLTDEADIILLQQINATRWTRWLAGPGEPQP